MTGSATVKLFALGLLVSAATSCSPIVATNGNIVEADRLADIHEGTSNKSDVANALGTPSATGTLDTNTWYYIGQRTEKVAFMAPEVVERKVVVFHFDDSNTLRLSRWTCPLGRMSISSRGPRPLRVRILAFSNRC